MTNDTQERYGVITRLLHWGMAFFVLWQGLKFFDRIGDGEHWVGETLVSWHVSIGALLLVLVILRLIWTAKQKENRPVNDPAVDMLSKLGHRLMYVLLVLMPITGMLYVVGNGFPLSAFGVQLVAARGTETGWMLSLGALHSPMAWILLVMVIGHVGMALIHHFVKKDGVLQRML